VNARHFFNNEKKEGPMVKLYFVRHGEASSTWEQASDPGLSQLGLEQAQKAAEEMQLLTDPISIFSSPLMRAQETAAPLTKIWQHPVEILPGIAEVPSGDISLTERRAWLENLMVSDWSTQPARLHDWRNKILSVLHEQKRDAVFFTHFMVLNVIVGAIENKQRVMSYRPDNCSILQVAVNAGGIELLSRGQSADTRVN
jgi:broad specificity phosphatase PhoE